MRGYLTGFFGNNPGGVLLSHTASRAVPSAPKSLTSEFGMGSGVASSKSPPETVAPLPTRDAHWLILAFPGIRRTSIRAGLNLYFLEAASSFQSLQIRLASRILRVTSDRVHDHGNARCLP